MNACGVDRTAGEPLLVADAGLPYRQLVADPMDTVALLQPEAGVAGMQGGVGVAVVMGWRYQRYRFAWLVEVVKERSLGRISHALYDVGGSTGGRCKLGFGPP